MFGVPDLCDQIPNGTYNDLRNSIPGRLEVTPSIISTNYLCSVPHRKSIGNLIISILVADLVLLKTAWAVYTFIVGKIFLRGPTANYCPGCLSRSGPSAATRRYLAKLPSLDMATTKSSSTMYEPMQQGAMDSTENLVRRVE